MGFRPFFLGAALFAIAATGYWLHALASGASPAGGYLRPAWWHAHEMIFGLALAVVAGFLLTAVRNWTGQNTLHGYPLLGALLIWVAGRILSSLPVPGPVIATVNVAFPAVLALVLGRIIARSGKRRNYGIVVVLAALTAASLLVHLDANGVLTGTARAGLHGAVHLVVLLNVVIGGRVIPMFTRNRTGVETRKVPAIDRAAIAAAAGVAALATGQAALPSSVLIGYLSFGVATLSGILQLVRMRTWGVGAGLRVPMLAVLHGGYAWIGVGHLLLAASILSPALTPTVALHALTIGVIGTMTVGMMARVTLGHTGRPIGATWPLTAAFVAMSLAVVARLAEAFLPAPWVLEAWILSGALFALAYLLYLVVAVKPLTTPRPDERPG
jgi:uncharacterized protein involved in response to NO